MTASLWMTPKQAGEYSQHHPETVYAALREYVVTEGRKGLRGLQPRPNACWRIHRDDVDLWMAGETPARSLRPVRRSA